MTRNQDHAMGLELLRSQQYMPQQCAPSQLVQHFGQFTFHAGAFARCHDHDV
jgi:hypothetical protein